MYLYLISKTVNIIFVLKNSFSKRCSMIFIFLPSIHLFLNYSPSILSFLSYKPIKNHKSPKILQLIHSFKLILQNKPLHDHQSLFLKNRKIHPKKFKNFKNSMKSNKRRKISRFSTTTKNT